MATRAPMVAARPARSRLRAAGSVLALGSLAGLGVWLAQPDADEVAAITLAEQQQHLGPSGRPAPGVAASLPGGTDPRTRPCLTYALATPSPATTDAWHTLRMSLHRPAGYNGFAGLTDFPWLAGPMVAAKEVDKATGWSDVMVMGGSSRAERWGSLQDNAHVQMRCWLASSGYKGDLLGTQPVFDRAETRDGRPAWHLRERLKTTSGLGDDLADVIVVDGTDPEFQSVLLSGSLVRTAAEQRDLDTRIAGFHVR